MQLCPAAISSAVSGFAFYMRLWESKDAVIRYFLVATYLGPTFRTVEVFCSDL